MNEQELAELLRQKERELETWARENGLVGAGQQVVVKIEVVPIPVVKLEVSVPKKRGGAASTDVPISENDWVQIFSQNWSSNHSRILCLLQEGNNAPIARSQLCSQYAPVERINTKFSKLRLPFRIRATTRGPWLSVSVKLFRVTDGKPVSTNTNQ